MPMNMQNVNPNLESMLDCYMQRGGWIDGSVIEKHDRETDNGYSRRKRLICSPALYTHLINTYDILFARTPTRFVTSETDGNKETKEVNPVYELFIDDCGYGLGLNSFLNQSLKKGAVLGACFIVMDADKEQGNSIDAMIANRSYPYITMVMPQDVTCLVVDLVGRIHKFGYYYAKWDQEIGTKYEKVYSSNGTYEDIKHYKDDKGQPATMIVDSGSTTTVGVPVIPVIPSQEPLVTASIPASPTVGLFQLQKNVVNNLSMVDEGITSNQFAILVIKTDKTTESLVLGANSALTIGPQDSADFIAPSSAPIDSMMKKVDSNVALMVKTFANMITSSEAQSGVAKVIDRQVGSMQLKQLAEYMQTIEYKIYEMFCEFVPSAMDSGYTVEYFKEFDMSDIGVYISQATEMLGANLSPDTVAEIKKDLVKKFFAGMDKKDVQRLINAESMNMEPAEGTEDDVVEDEEEKTTEENPVEPVKEVAE